MRNQTGKGNGIKHHEGRRRSYKIPLVQPSKHYLGKPLCPKARAINMKICRQCLYLERVSLMRIGASNPVAHALVTTPSIWTFAFSQPISDAKLQPNKPTISTTGVHAVRSLLSYIFHHGFISSYFLYGKS